MRSVKIYRAPQQKSAALVKMSIRKIYNLAILFFTIHLNADSPTSEYTLATTSSFTPHLQVVKSGLRVWIWLTGKNDLTVHVALTKKMANSNVDGHIVIKKRSLRLKCPRKVGHCSKFFGGIFYD